MLAVILSTVIFVAMFLLIVSEKFERQWVSLTCALLMILVVFNLCMADAQAVRDVLALGDFLKLSFWYVGASAGEESSSGINWATIIFLAGMMIMVEGMGNSGFFRWLCLLIAKLVKYKVLPLFITFMAMSFALAMFIDSITVILFLAAVTIELATLLKFNAVPLIISEIFCANLGGSATMCGDPPNIIIGTSLGYTFADFIKNTGLIALICLGFVIAYFFLVFKKDLQQEKQSSQTVYPSPASAITGKREFVVSLGIFLLAVVLLVTHAQTGLTVATIGTGIAILTLITSGKTSVKILRAVDYKTLLFFIGLFVVVGGLEKTGVLNAIALFIAKISDGNVKVMISIVIWVSALASAFVDNIPFAATMIPVIKALSISQGVDLSALAWTLAMGTDIGGSATPIGASANVVGISVASRSGYIIGWGKYCKYAGPATVIVVAVCMICIFFRYI